MRKATTAPEKSGAVRFAELDEAKNVGVGKVCPGAGFSGHGFAERSEAANRRAGSAPSPDRRAERPAAGSPVASEARWQALGNVAYLTAHSDARLCKLKFPQDRDTRKGGGVRGKVSGFSHGSRLRLMERINTILRESAMPTFVTLTFPDLFPDWKTAKKAIDVLGKRWKRRWPSTAILWRMEAMDRKSGTMVGQVAPHFHLMVWGEFDVEKAKVDWFEICGNSEYAHWRHGCDAEEVRTWKVAMAYVAKYISKIDLEPSEGRCWGIINRKALPVDKHPVRLRLTWREAWALRRTIRKAIAAKTGRKVKCAQTLYSSDPESLLRFVAMLRGRRHVTRRDDNPTPLRPSMGAVFRT